VSLLGNLLQPHLPVEKLTGRVYGFYTVNSLFIFQLRLEKQTNSVYEIDTASALCNLTV